jgi:hypothetical protein
MNDKVFINSPQTSKKSSDAQKTETQNMEYRTFMSFNNEENLPQQSPVNLFNNNFDDNISIKEIDEKGSANETVNKFKIEREVTSFKPILTPPEKDILPCEEVNMQRLKLVLNYVMEKQKATEEQNKLDKLRNKLKNIIQEGDYFDKNSFNQDKGMRDDK